MKKLRSTALASIITIISIVGILYFILPIVSDAQVEEKTFVIMSVYAEGTR